MDKESVDRLRFDRRLQRRRNWLEDGEYTTHVDALPDLTDKMTTGSDAEEAEAAEATEAAAPPLFGAPPAASETFAAPPAVEPPPAYTPTPPAAREIPEPEEPVRLAGHFPDEENQN